MQRGTLILVLLALPVIAASAPATAETVGASGQCYSADASSGGQDAVEVDTDDPTDPTLLSGTGAAAALVEFASHADQTGNQCGRYDCGPGTPNACGSGQTARFDYLEAHAAGTQVCYAGTVRTDGSCPTSPTGPG